MNTTNDKAIKQFVKERNEALLSCDSKAIKKYCKKYGVPMPENEWVFWRGIEKALQAITNIDPNKKQKALKKIQKLKQDVEVKKGKQ